jgi:hypothetical protein
MYILQEKWSLENKFSFSNHLSVSKLLQQANCYVYVLVMVAVLVHFALSNATFIDIAFSLAQRAKRRVVTLMSCRPVPSKTRQTALATTRRTKVFQISRQK